MNAITLKHNNAITLVLLSLILLTASTSYAELVSGQAAAVVIGQTDFTSSGSGTSQTQLKQVRGLFTDGRRLFLADSTNNRVLIYNSIPTTNGASADVVIGQADFTSGLANRGLASPQADTLSNPTHVFYNGKKLFISDRSNNRVLIYNSIPTTNGASADVVMGQTDFTTKTNGVTQTKFYLPNSVYSDGKRLFVADIANSRVLIYNSIPTTNGASADTVLGQPNFTSNTAVTTQNGFNYPAYIYFDGKKLFIADSANNRVLIYNSIPTTNGASADVVLGQPNFTSNTAATTQNGFNSPVSIFSDGKRLFVAAEYNARVVVYNSIPTSNGAAADVAIGQTNFTSQSMTPVTASSMQYPEGVASDGRRLFVAPGNNRVLIYNIAGSSPEKLGPQFEQGKALIGKVFNDVNGNGTQDNGENGIEGVKIATDTGIYAITDSDGKYHFPYIEVGQHLLKIDTSTLPEGSVITTDNPYKVTVTEGVLTKVSFGVQLPKESSEVINKGIDNGMDKGGEGIENGKEGVDKGPLLKVSVSQDPVMLKPRLSISHKLTTSEPNNPTTQKPNNDNIVFSIDCNYYLFIAKSNITLYDSDYKVVKVIDLPNPIPSTYTLPISTFSNPITLKPNNPTTLYYQLTVYDKNGKKDRTSVGSLEL